MDEKILAEIKSTIVDAVADATNKSEEHQTEINALNDKIAGLEASLSAKEVELEEKNNEIASLNSTIEQYKADIEDKDAKIAEANTAAEQAKKDNAKAELNSLLANYSDDEKAVAKEDIDAFLNDPGCVEINSIIGKICTEMVRKAREEENAGLDIFSMVDGGDNSGDDVDVF